MKEIDEKEILKMEAKAYDEKIANDPEGRAHMTAGMTVGLEKVNELCRVVFENGQEDTLAEYATALMSVGFHLGYTSALEDKG